MQLTERDAHLLELLYKHRFLRTDQMLALACVFAEPYTKQTLWRRLRMLCKHNYVAKLAKRQQGRTVYCLGKQGAKLIAAEQKLPLKQVAYGAELGERFLVHKLAIADFRVALTLALLKLKPTRKLEWVSELELRRQAVQVPVSAHDEWVFLNPDALVIFEDPVGRLMQAYLEIDLATETHGEFAKKVRAYLSYTCAEVRFAQHRVQVPFKILTVTTSTTRRDNLLLTTEEQGGGVEFCFTTFKHLTPENILGRVWKVAGGHSSTESEEDLAMDTSGRAKEVSQPALWPVSSSLPSSIYSPPGINPVWLPGDVGGYGYP